MTALPCLGVGYSTTYFIRSATHIKAVQAFNKLHTLLTYTRKPPPTDDAVSTFARLEPRLSLSKPGILPSCTVSLDPAQALSPTRVIFVAVLVCCYRGGIS